VLNFRTTSDAEPSPRQRVWKNLVARGGGSDAGPHTHSHSPAHAGEGLDVGASLPSRRSIPTCLSSMLHKIISSNFNERQCLPATPATWRDMKAAISHCSSLPPYPWRAIIWISSAAPQPDSEHFRFAPRTCPAVRCHSDRAEVGASIYDRRRSTMNEQAV